ncbi:thioredoxin family protein [Bacteroidota bacterium]
MGSKASDFKLLNVDGEYVSLSDFEDTKGFILIFSCNHCPYVKAYEQRMIEIHNKFAEKGYPIIAINSNDSTVQPADSYSKMISNANEKNFPFVYLLDNNHEVQEKFGAQRTPHIYLLQKVKKDLIVKYIGTIDDSPMKPDEVKEKYLENALLALLDGKQPDPNYTKAIGCSIKKKKE